MKILYIIVSKVLPRTIYERLWRRMNWKKYASRFDDAIKHFVVEKGTTNPTEVSQIRNMLVKAFIKDNWYPDEFFFYNYDRLSRKGIHDFVPHREASKFWKYQNSQDVYLLTCDKGRTYQHFNLFFNRDLVSVNNEPKSKELFLDFISKHSRFIIKPTFGNYGNGVKVIDTINENRIEELADGLLDTYKEGFVAEELISQCDELASFHPSSVNTVRLTTVRLDNGEVYIIHRPFIRFGQGGRVVDNGGNGGIIGGIDNETGIIYAAIDEKMNHYIVHPDSGKTILGYRIPHWAEAKAFVIKLADVIPELRYCGWDIALTDDGWVMVEANGKGLFIGFQMPSQEGFRDEFEEIKKMCGYKG
ncbi:MAG: hypothetical protein IKX60_06930 [Bacteroidales bacterium]|nr:hypothetical protein [Bacteroidales bacterium]